MDRQLKAQERGNAWLKKILVRNGFTPWPQIFHALLGFRINEMERDQNLGTVEICEHTGNSESTARKHYSRVSREDRQRTANRWPSEVSEPTADQRIASEGVRSPTTQCLACQTDAVSHLWTVR